MATGSIWDYFKNQNMGVGGWSPSGGMEGSPNRNVVTASGNAQWQANQPGVPQPSQPSGGGDMPRKPNLMDQMQNLSNQMQRMGSYFPAAGQVIGGGNNTPSVAAMNRDTQDYGSLAGGAPRLNKNNITTYQLPSGGFASVKRGSSGVPDYAKLYQSGNQVPFNQAQSFNQGYGAPTPSIQNGYLVQGGVANPTENLTPQQRSQYGASTFGERLGQTIQGARIGLGAVGTLAYNAARSVGNMFNRQQPSTQSQNYYAYNPSPIPQQPRRYSDYY